MGPVDPILLKWGPFEIRWYGFLLVVAALAGAWVAARQARRRGDNPDHVWNMLALCIILGLIGARMYHVFSTPAGGSVGWAFYREYPLQIVAFWQGGLQGFGIYGAVAGGVLGVWLYTRLARLPFLRWLDYGAVGLILAQAIGRWGNFFNQELYGPPTNLPWGVVIAPENRLAGLEAYERFHPLFLYESLLDLALGAGLIWLSRRRASALRDGDLFFGYLIGYGIIRFSLEFLRPDAWKLGPIAVAQIVALGTILVGGAALYLRRRRPSRSSAPAAE